MAKNNRITIQDMRDFMAAAQMSIPQLANAMGVSDSSIKLAIYNVRPVSQHVSDRFRQVQKNAYDAVGGEDEFHKITKQFNDLQAKLIEGK